MNPLTYIGDPPNDFDYDVNNDGAACGGPSPRPTPPQKPAAVCLTPTSFPTFVLPGGTTPVSQASGGIASYPLTGQIWVPDLGSDHVYVVSYPNPVLLATVNVTTYVNAAPVQVLYDPINDQMIVLTQAADLVFVNPHTFAVTGNIQKVVVTVNGPSGGGFPFMSYDSKRGHVLVNWVQDPLALLPVPLVLVDGHTKSVLFTSTVPAQRIGNNTYSPATDTFYFGVSSSPVMQTLHPVTGAVGLSLLNVGANKYPGFLRWVQNMSALIVGVSTTALNLPGTVEAYNPVTNTNLGTLTGTDVPNPWDIRHVSYNSCTNLLYTSDVTTGGYIIRFNPTTLVESSKVILQVTAGIAYVQPQNVVWVYCEPSSAELVSLA